MKYEKGSIAKTEICDVEYKLFGIQDPSCIVVVHGTPGGYEQAEPYLYDLINKYNCRVLTWSRPGYGATPLMGCNKTPVEQALLLKQLMDELDINNAVIYSIGTGSSVAYHFASLFPEKCLGLIIESGVSKKYFPHYKRLSRKFVYHPAVSKFHSIAINLLYRMFPRYIIKTALSATSSISDAENSVTASIIHRDSDKSKIFRMLLNSVTNPTVREAGTRNDLFQLRTNFMYPLVNILAPALLVHGEKDTDTPVDHAEYASCALQNSKFFEVKDGTHILPLSLRQNSMFRAKVKFLNAVTGRTGKGIDLIVDSQYQNSLPSNYKRFPSKMPMCRVGITDVKAIRSDGASFSMYDADDPVQEYIFAAVLRKYGGLHGGLEINANRYTTLFRLCNDNGGFIPMIMFPALISGGTGSIKIEIDGYTTEIYIPAFNGKEWRAVIGGYFPHENVKLDDENHVAMTLGERNILNIVNPINDIEANAPGLYFERTMTVSFKGECVDDRHGKYSCFTYLMFTSPKD